MKKERIMINGIKYRYIINDSNEIEMSKPVSKEVLNLIKQTLIKKGKYQEVKHESIKVHYDENYLKRRFQKWTKIELKLYLEELEEKHRNNTITSEEKLLVQPIREEIERRSKNDKSRND